MPRLSSQSPKFLWVCNHCMLKTSNEAVVEGMCKFISKQADSSRGITFKGMQMWQCKQFSFPYPFHWLAPEFLCYPGMRTRRELYGMDLCSTKQTSFLRNAWTTTLEKGRSGIFTASTTKGDRWSALCRRWWTDWWNACLSSLSWNGRSDDASA